MTIDPEFLECMPSTVTVQRYTGEDTRGNNTFSAAEPFKARIDSHERSMSQGTSGSGTIAPDARIITSVIMDYEEPPFGIRDKITLPDGRIPKITAVQVHYDERGPHHLVLTCEDPRER